MKKHGPGSAVLLLFLALAGIGCSSLVPSEPEDITVNVVAPLQAAKSQEFVVEIQVKNTADHSQTLDSIDISDSYLAGIAIQRSEPAFKESFHIPVVNFQSYSFKQTVSANGNLTVKFRAMPLKAGDYSAQVDVCINNEASCLSHPIRTVVAE